MLSKPKYMLPGNLSQGAPILEPDENNNYNFVFALDGDEKIKDAILSIYTLQGERSVEGNFELEIEDLDYEALSYNLEYKDKDKVTININMKIGKRNESGEYGLFSKELNFSPLEEYALESYSEMKLSFKNYFNKDNFLVETTYKDLQEQTEVEAYEPQAAILPILITNSGADVSRRGFFMLLGPLNFFQEFETEIPCILRFKDKKWYLEIEPMETILSYSFYIKDFNDFNFNFNYRDAIYFQKGIYQLNQKIIETKYDYSEYETFSDRLIQYQREINNPTTNLAFKGNKGRKYRYFWDQGGTLYQYSLFSYFSNKITSYSDISYLRFPNKLSTIKFDGKYLSNDFRIEMSSEDKNESFKIDKEDLKDKFLPLLESADEMNTPFAGANSAFDDIDNDAIYLMLKVNKPFLSNKESSKLKFIGKIKTSAFESIKCYEEIKKIDDYPKNEKGKFNFFNFTFSDEKVKKIFAFQKEYFWIIKTKDFNDNIYESDPQVFKFFNKAKSYQFFTDVVKNIYGVKENDSFVDYDIIEYQYEIKDDKNIIYYKSPLIKSSNMQFTQLPIYSLPSKNYKIYFTATNKNMQTIKLNSILPESKHEGLKLNYNYNSVEKKLNFSFASDEFKKYIKSYILYRYDIKNDKYFIVKDGLTQKDGAIEIIDEFNSSEKFQYFISVIWDKYYLPGFEPQYEHSNFSSVFINDEKKWRLILTKEKKSDIIYSVDKVYDFYYNLVSGSIGNNAETTINTNFTNMPSVQKGFSNYWSGSLSALMGVCDERGEFAQTIEQEKALEQLVLDQEHDKFLLDREGNVWQVEVSAPLTIANQDGLVQVDKLIDLKTITINWVQVGSPTQIIFDFEE